MDNSSQNGVSAIVEYDYVATEPDELTLKKGAIITNIKIQAGGWWEGTSSGKVGMFPDNFIRVLEPDDKNPVVLRDKSATQNRRCKVIYSYRENKNDELSLAVGDIIEFFEETFQVEEGWWRGKLNGKVGVFPSNFVVIIESVSPVSANRTSATNSINANNNLTNLTKSNSINKSRTSLNSSREDLDTIPPSHHHAPPSFLHKSSEQIHDAPSLPPKPIRELCKVLFAYSPANEDELKLVEGEVITILTKELPDKGWWKGELKGRVGVFPDNFVTLLPPEVSPIKDSNHPKPERPPLSTKMLINKSPNNSANSSYRKDSFGSRDSLNDSGIITSTPVVGNVAAHRKSLENKNAPVETTVVTPPTTNEKPPRKGLDTKTTSEIRKSLENLDDKKSTPPPVLGKKPQVPIKKSPSITSVTGNIFAGLKQKVKGVENKLHSQDSADGIGSSRMSQQIPDNNEKSIIGEKIMKDDSEFGHVERGSAVLKDMRANRAKAPKRRPPSSAVSLIGESYNISGMSNGNGNGIVPNEPDSPKPDLLNTSHHSSSNDDEFVAKPKTREWEKHKVPWMDELKASQAKKTSPSIEPKSPEHHHHEENKFDMSKSFHITTTTAASSTLSSTAVVATRKISERSSTVSVENSFDLINSSSNKKEFNQHSTSLDHSSTAAMTKSMSSLSTKISISDNSSHEQPTNNIRPTSVNLRNRSISPTPIVRNTKTIHITTTNSNALNDPTPLNPINSDNVCSRVCDLEHKVNKLEKLLSSQNQVIEDLTKSLRDESDQVKKLQKELEKYAQCVTQV